jgi:predicted lipoprotein with Yx(FWY)xxD motif
MYRTKSLFAACLVLFMLLGLAPLALAQEVTVQVADHPELGRILTDGEGMVLYLFTRDEENVTNCYDDCAVNWPPLLVGDGQEPVAGEGLTGELGVIERDDGGRQVTYNGMPLYYWIRDEQPGDATGQNVGGVWYVVHPDISSMTGTNPLVEVTEHPELGNMLTNQGFTLYLFTRDEDGVTNCYDDCAVNWPPLLVGEGGAPQAGEGVTGELGVIDRDDGGRQVTYNGIPLYFWIRDVRPGDVDGQGVGDVWYVVSPDTASLDAFREAHEAAEQEGDQAQATAEVTAQATAEATAQAEEPQTLPVTGGGAPPWTIVLLAVGGAALLAGGIGLASARLKR